MVTIDELRRRVDAAFVETGRGFPPWADPNPERSPAAEAYSRVTDPAKWRILGARAEAWVVALTEAGIATVERDVEIEWAEPPGPFITRADRLAPSASGGLPLVIARGRIEGVDDAGVTLGVGEPAICRGFVPDCGCDACDSGSQDALDVLDEMIDSVVTGAFRRLARGSSTIAVTEGYHSRWSASGDFRRVEIEAVIADPVGWHELSGPSWLPDHPARSAPDGAAPRLHDDQIEITTGTVSRLVADQFPDWPWRRVERVGTEGTVHAIFRLGDRVAARFPIRPSDPESVRATLTAEQAALTELRAHLTVAVPTPYGIGEPGGGYPLPWAAQRWLPGAPAWDAAASGDVHTLVDDVVSLLRELRAIPVRGRSFSRSGRGGDLRAHDDWVTTCLTHSEGLLPVDTLRQVWNELRVLPRQSPGTVTHGDLIPGNLLVADGRLVGVLDPSMFGAADPALDLIVAWHLFDRGLREELRSRLEPLGVSDLDWERGKAWAFEQSIGLVWYYETTNPTMSRLGRKTLERVIEDT